MQSAVDPHIQDEAASLLNMLCETAGRRIITGQHTQTVPMEEAAYIRSVTGREPKLIGVETGEPDVKGESPEKGNPIIQADERIIRKIWRTGV